MTARGEWRTDAADRVRCTTRVNKVSSRRTDRACRFRRVTRGDNVSSSSSFRTSAVAVLRRWSLASPRAAARPTAERRRRRCGRVVVERGMHRCAAEVHVDRRPSAGRCRTRASTTEAQNGQNAALQAVNGECALGRPIEIIHVRRQVRPERGNEVRPQAHDDGSLALFGSSGSYDDGTSAANLPGVITGGGSVFDLTDPRSFSISSPLTLVVGGSATAAAAGVNDALDGLHRHRRDAHVRRDLPAGRARSEREAGRACSSRPTRPTSRPVAAQIAEPQAERARADPHDADGAVLQRAGRRGHLAARHPDLHRGHA